MFSNFKSSIIKTVLIFLTEKNRSNILNVELHLVGVSKMRAKGDDSEPSNCFETLSYFYMYFGRLNLEISFLISSKLQFERPFCNARFNICAPQRTWKPSRIDPSSQLSQFFNFCNAALLEALSVVTDRTFFSNLNSVIRPFKCLRI